MRRRPHVAIVIANLPAERDRRVIRECLSLEEAGFEVTVIAPRGDRTLRTLPGSRGTRLRPYPVYVLGSGVLSYAFEFLWSFTCVAVRLLGEVVAGRAHAVQACNPPDIYWPLALAFRAFGRPWVFDHHDLCPEIYATRSGGRPKRIVFRTLELFESLTLRTATAVFLTNESFRENALCRGIDPSRLTVVRNGPAYAEVGEPTADAAARTDGRHEVVYLGVLGPQDNVDGAVLAAEELTRLRGRTDWIMTIAGEGETFAGLTKLAADHGLGDVVRFTGWLDGHAVDELLQRASVAIQPDLPTTMNDRSTMAKTVEYLSRGVPVVAADLTETRRSAGDAAVYVPNGTPQEYAVALNELLEDPARRERMRAAGRQRFAEMLAWEHQAAAYISVWRRLLHRRLSPRAAAESGALPAETASVVSEARLD